MKYTEIQVAGSGGGVIPYCQVTVYFAGTTTKASLFDLAGSATSNPLTTNATGLVGFKVADGLYDVAFSAPSGATLPNMSSLQVVDELGQKQYRAITHSSSIANRTIDIDGLELRGDTSGGDIFVVAPLGVVPASVRWENPLKMIGTKGGDIIVVTTDADLSTEKGRVTNTVDGSGAGGMIVTTTSSTVLVTGNA